MHKGEKFEQLTTEIFEFLTRKNEYESVLKNVKLLGPDGNREIDVLITGKVGPFVVKTIVECKDYKRKVNVMVVDALHSKMVDVNANKAVLVTRNGFSRGAISKAKRLGISLCTANHASDESWKFEPQMPILITEHCCEKSEISFAFTAIANMTKLEITHIAERSIGDLIAEHWNEAEIEYVDGIVHHLYEPKIKKPYIKINNDRNLDISELKINMEIRTTHYLGFFNDLDSTKFLRYIDDDKIHIIFDVKDLNNYRDHFERFERIEDVSPHLARANFDIKHMLERNPKLNVIPNDLIM